MLFSERRAGLIEKDIFFRTCVHATFQNVVNVSAENEVTLKAIEPAMVEYQHPLPQQSPLAEKVIFRDDLLITALALSANKDRLVIGNAEGGLQVWDISTNRKLFDINVPHITTYYEPTNLTIIRDVAFTLHNDIISASMDGTVKIWQVRNGRLKQILQHHAPVLTFALSPDGQWLVSGTADGHVCVWQTQNWYNAHKFFLDEAGEINCIRFSASGKKMVCASSNGRLNLWHLDDWSTFELHVTQQTDYQSINACAFSRSEDAIVFGGEDGQVRVWDLLNNEIKILPLKHDYPITSCFYLDQDVMIVATSAYDGKVGCWKVNFAARLDSAPSSPQLPRAYSTPIHSSVSSPSPNILSTERFPPILNAITELATAIPVASPLALPPQIFYALPNTTRPTVRFRLNAMNVPSRPLLNSPRLITNVENPNHHIITCCAITALNEPNQYLVLSGAQNHELKRWVFDAKAQTLIPKKSMTGHRGRINCCEFSTDGQHLISCADDNLLRLRFAAGSSAPGGYRTREFAQKDGQFISTTSFSADGSQIVIGTKNLPHKYDITHVQVFEVSSARLTADLPTAASQPVTNCYLLPNNEILYSIMEQIVIYNFYAHTKEIYQSPTTINACDYHDSRIAAGLADGRIIIWNRIGLTPKIPISSDQSAWPTATIPCITACKFSHKGYLLIVGYADGTIRIYETIKYRCLFMSAAEKSGTTTIAISPDDKYIVVACADTLKIWASGI